MESGKSKQKADIVTFERLAETVQQWVAKGQLWQLKVGSELHLMKKMEKRGTRLIS